MSRHKARIVGVAAAAGTGAGLAGATAALTGPAANLGGYAVEQMVASTIGLGWPALATAIVADGGPAVAASAVAARATRAGCGCPGGRSAAARSTAVWNSGC